MQIRTVPSISRLNSRHVKTSFVGGVGFMFVVIAVIIISWKILMDSSSQSTMEKSVEKDSTSRHVRFEEIPAEGETRDAVLRYAAFFEKEGSSAQQTPSSPVTMADWISLMKTNKGEITQDMTKILQEAPFSAFRFETPGVSVETVHDQQFEFVLVKDTDLEKFAAQEDPDTFAEHLQCDVRGDATSYGPAACKFINLGGDAVLVSPRNWVGSTNKSNYHGHLANFMRGASSDQIVETWQMVALALEEQLLGHSPERPKSKPLWFSTAGDGVAWLHFRLDSRPKYYHYDPYRKFS
jgi:hypothetical protein